MAIMMNNGIETGAKFQNKLISIYRNSDEPKDAELVEASIPSVKEFKKDIPAEYWYVDKNYFLADPGSNNQHGTYGLKGNSRAYAAMTDGRSQFVYDEETAMKREKTVRGSKYPGINDQGNAVDKQQPNHCIRPIIVFNGEYMTYGNTFTVKSNGKPFEFVVISNARINGSDKFQITAFPTKYVATPQSVNLSDAVNEVIKFANSIEHEKSTKETVKDDDSRKKVTLRKVAVADEPETQEASTEEPVAESFKEDGTVPGYWYFTVHGIGPGTLPRGVAVEDCFEGKNSKGTYGDFVRLDRALTEEEVEYFDLQMESPKEYQIPIILEDLSEEDINILLNEQ